MIDQLIYSKLIPNKNILIKISWIINILGLCLVLISAILTPLQPYWIKLGIIAGNAALITFILTLSPGILKRYNAIGSLQSIRLLLMSLRRQLGIMMYFFVIDHYLWVRLMPSLKFSSSIIPTNLYEIIGMLAFFLLTPLFLSSNNFSVKKIGKKWNLLHKLVYLINWLIFLHLLLLGRGNWNLIIIFMLGITQAFSWRRASHKK